LTTGADGQNLPVGAIFQFQRLCLRDPVGCALFGLQIGIVTTPPLTINVIRSVNLNNKDLLIRPHEVLSGIFHWLVLEKAFNPFR
jgi:hypothetical protein